MSSKELKTCKLVQFTEKDKKGEFKKEGGKVIRESVKVTESYFNDFNKKSFPIHGQLYIELTESTEK